MRLAVILSIIFVQLPMSSWYKPYPKCRCVSHEVGQESARPKKKHKTIMHAAGYFVGDIIMDILALNRNLFSLETAKILTGFAPVYLIARRADEGIQSRFYDCATHTNINQFNQNCHKISKIGISIPMVGLSSLAIWGWNEDVRMTGRIYAIGIPFVHWTKDLIKTLEAKPCLRPWHEKFSRTQRSSGGFPSGHMANITYTASLFGMRFGLAWALPLGAFGAFLCADFLNCNRHYLSQLLAGAAFGLIYAVAANKVIEKKLNQSWQLACGINGYGASQMKVTYIF